MKKLRQITFLLGTLVQMSAAYAASPFDGRWVGTSTELVYCEGPLTVTLVVNGSTISGVVSGSQGSPAIQTAIVDASGGAHLSYGANGRTYQAVVRFLGDVFAGEFTTGCGVRKVTGIRL